MKLVAAAYETETATDTEAVVVVVYEGDSQGNEQTLGTKLGFWRINQHPVALVLCDVQVGYNRLCCNNLTTSTSRRRGSQ